MVLAQRWGVKKMLGVKLDWLRPSQMEFSTPHDPLG
jgi:hypothetical protein